MVKPKPNPVHSHDAPSGHKAIAHPGGLPCEGCAFRHEYLCPNVRAVWRCTPVHRKDGQSVIFVKS